MFLFTPLLIQFGKTANAGNALQMGSRSRSLFPSCIFLNHGPQDAMFSILRTPTFMFSRRTRYPRQAHDPGHDRSGYRALPWIST